jgi:hypothetical protein
VSFESLAAYHPIGFPPPLAEFSASPAFFEANWHLIQFVFGLPDPRGFPPFAATLPDDSLAILRRYSAAARELAESAFLAHPTGVTVNLVDGALEERVEERFPPKENVRGFSVLFRQFYSNEELASFNAVQRVLRQLNKEAVDDRLHARSDQLTGWGRAAGKLRGYSLKVLVGKRLQPQGQLPPGKVVNEHLPSPQMLISVYNYGEDIHWGEKRQQVAAWKESPFGSGSGHRVRRNRSRRSAISASVMLTSNGSAAIAGLPSSVRRYRIRCRSG